MAEFCLDCWNKLNKTNDNEKKYFLTKGLEFCEGCAQMKRVIIIERKYYYLWKLRFILLPFTFLLKILYTLCRILMLPYLLYQCHQEKKNK